MPDLFRTAPREVIEYFDGRGLKTSWRWKDFAAHQHALNFTVARTAGFDVLEDIQKAVRQAVVDRIPFDQFQKELTPLLQAKGWWGNRIVTAPNGEKERVQLGSVRRLQTIYWANTASSHAAGEWARTQATKDVLPFLQYKISLSERRRREHEGWVGITLPVDHPFWRTHYPPNGWHCKCRVEQIGATRASRAPDEKRIAPPLDAQMWTDKRTGKVWRVPKGIDPGWQRNPGVTREVVAAQELRRAMAGAVREGVTAAERFSSTVRIIETIRTTPDFKAISGRNLGYDHRRGAEHSMRTLGEMKSPIAAVPATISERLIAVGIRPPDAAIVELKVAIADKLRKHDLAQEDFDIPQHLMFSADDILITRHKTTGEVKITWSGFLKGKRWVHVSRVDEDAYTLITLMSPTERWSKNLKGRSRLRDSYDINLETGEDAAGGS
jgi:Phage Mu protein F like protein